MSGFFTLSRLFLNVQRLRLIQKSLDLSTICAILRPIRIGTRLAVQANRIGHHRPATPARTAVSDIVCAAMGARCVIFSRGHNRTTYSCNRLTKTRYRRGDPFLWTSILQTLFHPTDLFYPIVRLFANLLVLLTSRDNARQDSPARCISQGSDRSLRELPPALPSVR